MIDLDAQSRASAWLERAWLARYLERGLDEDETARFEAYVLDKPDLLREIEADNDLRDCLAAAGPALLAAEPAGSVPGAPPATPRVQRHPAVAWLALAASLLVGLGLGNLLRSGGAHRDAVEASPGRVVFDTLRGEALKPRWEFAAAGKPDELLIVDVSVASDAQKVSVQLPDGSERVLRVSAEGFATFIAPRALLAGKTVQMSVTGADGRQLQRSLEFSEGG